MAKAQKSLKNKAQRGVRLKAKTPQHSLITATISSIEQDYEKRGIHTLVFDDPVISLLAVIREKGVIKGVNLASKIQDPDFRFLSKAEPELSRQIADTLAEFAQHVKEVTVSEAARKRGNASGEKRSLKADEFAINTYHIIEKLKAEENIATIEDMVKILNEKGIETPRGKGKWHIQTLYNVTNRYKELNTQPE
ncbi:hypothetical protein BWI97_13885 [Siphonobacter sp. BAB-5405]|nr:hypothetical protein BWI97_13885 [Siphonobacter sp. BAB-5405]